MRSTRLAKLAGQISRLVRDLRIDLALALKEVTRRKRRSAVAVGAVAFGVMALMLSSGFIEWIFWAMREGTIRSGLGHVQITRPGYQQVGLSDPLSYLLPQQLPDLESKVQQGQIETLAPRLSFSGLLSFGDATLSFHGEGVEPALEEPLSRSMLIVDGEPLSTDAASREVLLGEGLAQNLGAKIGDRVVMLVNTHTGSINAVEATVSGLFATATKAYDDVAVRMPISMARELLRVEGATTWVLALRDTERTEQVITQIESSLEPAEYEVTSWYALSDFYRKTVVLFSKQLGMLDFIVVLVVVLTISNCMTIAVVERTGEIGTALALGATPPVLLRRFLVEGLMLGLVGAVLGVAVGIAAAKSISSIGIPMPPPPGMARGYVGEILLTPGLVGKGFMFVVASALAGAIVPATRASRMTIVDAIRQGK